ncbi:MAG: sugar-binding transcriptional regulator [Clostridiales bacterium]|nr:sugar-binding transcriptional regulator [Clostridiales bacterium]
METRFDISMMVKVAQMYYESGMKQEEIAKTLQISRSLISMILTEAKDAGIVEIRVRNPLHNNEVLAREFQERFKLKECLILQTAIQDSNNLRKLAAQRAVNVFKQEIEKQLGMGVASQYNIGIAWGRTCYEFVSAYKSDRPFPNVNIVPLIGGSNQNASYFQLNEIVRQFAKKIKGTPYFIHAPGITSSAEEKLLFIQSQSMQPILERWMNMDMVISGIGTLPDLNNSDRETYMGEFEIYKQYEKKGAIGDICARYFDINGEFIEDSVHDKILGISIDDLKKTNKIFCVASGSEKANSILGALRTGIIDILVIDESTANMVLKASL